MILNTILHGDCIGEIEKLPDASVDLIIADPPYNIGKDFGERGIIWNDLDEWLKWSKEWIVLSNQKLKSSGSIFIYGSHRYMCYIQVYLYELGLHYGRQFIWHYENNFSRNSKSPSVNYEVLLWFSKSENYTYHQIREPYKSTERLKNKIIKDGKVWTPNPEGRHGGDVWNFPVLAGKRFEKERVDHPTQKPLSISNRIVKHFSDEGDTILIPFAGSGSECVACVQNQRNYIGIEINDKYIPIIKERLSNETQPIVGGSLEQFYSEEKCE